MSCAPLDGERTDDNDDDDDDDNPFQIMKLFIVCFLKIPI